MSENPFFSGRIPQELYDRVVSYAEETGESKTQVLRNALAAYVNYTIADVESPAKAIGDRFAALEARIIALEKREEPKTSGTPRQALPDVSPEEDLKEIQNTEPSDPEVQESSIAEETPTPDLAQEPMMLTISRIHQLPGLENWEHKKLTKKLNNIITQTRRSPALEGARASISIGPYTFEEAGKQEGRVLWRVTQG